MEASRAEGRGAYLDFSRLTPGEYFGMGSALVLFLSLWLPWFTTSEDNPNSVLAGASAGEGANAWQVFTTLDWLLALACTAPFILSWIIARGHELSWARGEMTAVGTIAALGLIFFNGVISRPGEPSSQISLQIGWYLALLGAAMIVVGSSLRAAETGRARRPPGTF
jgi:hypothetical protein